LWWRKYKPAFFPGELFPFESLFLVPDKMDMMEVYQIMTSLVNLRPGILQKLLEVCTSVKVKRLLLYMAKKANHQWFTFIDLSTVNLGTGDRCIVKNGNYNSEFRITIPKELTTDSGLKSSIYVRVCLSSGLAGVKDLQ